MADGTTTPRRNPEIERGRIARRHPGWRLAAAVMVTALLGSMLALLGPSPAGAEPLPPGTLGGFENEGDQDDATLDTGNIDWETVKTDPRITEWALIHDDGDVDTADSTFLDSSKEQDPSTWGCAANESPPKDDIFRLYLAAQISQQAQFLHIGYVREKPVGDTDINVEFNRATSDFACPGGAGRVRSDGDLMVSFTFGGGSDPSAIDVYQWDDSEAVGEDSDFVPADGHWNLLDLPDGAAKGADNAAYNGGKDPGDLPKIADQFFDDSVLDPRQFGEVTLDLSALYEGGVLGCPGTGFVTGHSRASHSFASDLKDIFPETPFDLSDCASIKIKKVDDSNPGVATAGAVYGLYDTKAKADAVAGQSDADAIAAAVSTCTTEADGTCLLTDADPEKDYWITEITPPAGLLPSTEVRAVSKADLEPFGTLDLTGTPFVNNVPVGDVTIVKRLFEDKNDNDTLDPGEQVTPDQMSDLDGIKFELQQGGVTAEKHPSGAAAECTIAGGTGQCTISSMKLGTYDIKETLSPTGPSGVGVGDSPSVTIDENGETVTAYYDNPLSPINVALDKTGPDFAEVGEQITYKFDVSTTGVPLTITQLYEVIDTDNGFDDRCDAGTPLTGPDKSTTVDADNDSDSKLEIGETWRWTCKHVVTLADATDDDGLELWNKAHVDGKDDVGRTASAEDTHKVLIKLPDLKVTKLAADGVDSDDADSDDETIDAPGVASYEIVVTNEGDATAPNTTLTDDLPDGDWNVSLADADGDDVCPVGGNTVSGSFTCTIGDLEPGDSKTVTVSRPVTIENDCEGPLVNGVEVSTTSGDDDIDLNDENDTASASISVRCPDVQVEKEASNSPVSAGQRLEWTITVTNLGAGPAPDVHLVDDVAAGLTAVQVGGADGGDCDVDGNTVSCDFGQLGANDGEEGGDDTRTITVSGLTDPADCGTVPNTASLSDGEDGDYVDTNPDNNSDAAPGTVLCPDISIIKEADVPLDEGYVNVGDPIGFTITAHNAGPGMALGASITDPLPDSDLVEWSVDPAVEGCEILLGDLVCTIGDLAAGASFSVHVTGTTPAEVDDLTSCTQYDNTATVHATNDDDESSSDSTQVCPLDITIVKDGEDLAHRGDTVTYTFDVTNSGAADLVEVELIDPICDADTIDLVDDGDGDSVLAIGETWSYTCTRVIRDDDPDPLPNTAQAVGTDVNGRTTDDTDDHVVDIISPAIEIVKTVDNETPGVGETVTFTYVVTNTGDTTLFDVDVTDDQLGTIGKVDQLEPGESATLTKTMLVAEDSPTRNVATAEGEDVLEKSVTDDDDATITIVLGEVIEPAELPKTGAESVRNTFLALSLILVGAGLLLGAWAIEGPRRRRLH